MPESRSFPRFPRSSMMSAEAWLGGWFWKPLEEDCCCWFEPELQFCGSAKFVGCGGAAGSRPGPSTRGRLSVEIVPNWLLKVSEVLPPCCWLTPLMLWLSVLKTVTSPLRSTTRRCAWGKRRSGCCSASRCWRGCRGFPATSCCRRSFHLLPGGTFGYWRGRLRALRRGC